MGKLLQAGAKSIFFNLGTEFATEFGPNETVKEVTAEKQGEGVVVGLDDEGEGSHDKKETGDGTLGAPIQSFEAGVADLAKHHKTEKKEKGG